MHRDPLQPLTHVRSGAPRRRSRAARAALGVALIAAAAIALASSPARATGRIQKFRGQLGIGYAKLVGDPSPGGSFSMGVGVDYPVGGMRAGLAFGYDLLGGELVERGSFVANVDYSLVEVLALAHLAPSNLGWLRRVSFGPGLFSAKADLQAAAGGAGFSDLAVEEFAPGIALDGTLMMARPSAVRIGLELGGRMVFLEEDTWTMGLVRLAFHY